MTPKDKSSLLPDRRHAPKKTGKRLMPPEDSADKLVTEQKKMGPAPGLLADNPPVPAIVNGRFLAFYEKPTFALSKEEEPLITLRFSVALEKGHDAVLPKVAAEAHRDVLKRGRNLIRLQDVPAQHALIFVSENHASEIAVLPAAKMTGNVSIVERRGEGTVRKTVRLMFYLQTLRAEPLAHFAETNMHRTFWVQLKNTQESLWDETEKEE